MNENACRNRGYILDGYPRTYKDAQYIFLTKKKIQNEEGEWVEVEDEEQEEGEEKNFDNYIPDTAIFPSSVIVLNGEDKFLIERIRALPERSLVGTHYNYEDMCRRLKAYRIANNSKVAEPSVSDFFAENNVQVFSEDCVQPQDKVVSSFKIYIERVRFLCLIE